VGVVGWWCRCFVRWEGRGVRFGGRFGVRVMVVGIVRVRIGR